jgi:D-glycero-D-manno-heptose 1,7-bisphosphate phosphatase
MLPGTRTGGTVFLDRDGVINVNRRDYVKRWEEFEFLPRALAGLALLADHGCNVVIVTNQSVINRGLVSQAEIDELHARMLAVIAHHGGRVASVLCCPHRPSEGCECRKPRPGLLFHARDQLGVDLTNAIMVGDHPTDLEAGQRAGCASILVLSGRAEEETAELASGEQRACLTVAPDLLAAAEWIVARAYVLPAAERPSMAPTAARTVALRGGPR